MSICAPRPAGEAGSLPLVEKIHPWKGVGGMPKFRADVLRSERGDSAGQRRGEDAKGVASAEVWRAGTGEATGRAGSPSYQLKGCAWV